MLEPGQKQAAYELADAYIRLEHFEPAVRLCRNLTENNPAMEQAWYRLGIAYLNWSKATSRKLIDSRPRSGWGSLLLAAFAAMRGLRDDVAQARTIAAEIKFEQEPAIDGALQAARQATHDARSLYRLSLELRELARATFEQTVNRNPDSYRAHLLLAELASDSRDQAAAGAEYRKAAELALADPEVQLLYVQWLVVSEDGSGALSVARRPE